MNWGKVKTVVSVGLLILATEAFRLYTQIPVTILDVLLLPITGILIFVGFYGLLQARKEKRKEGLVVLNTWQLMSGVIVVIILAPMAIWLAWIGAEEPFSLFTSVKGSAHGYTLAHLGAIMTIYCTGIGCIFVYRLFKLAKKQLNTHL